MIDEQAAAELAESLAERVAERVETARRRQADQQQARADKDARRTAGLRARHATKLARTRRNNP